MESEILALQDALAGEYSFERELGRGGMGVVYLARDVQLDRPVAIKVLPARLAERPDVRERFLREARTAAGLSHPNIVPIHRVGEAAGLPYFVMTFVEGATLGERLRERGPVSPATMAQILRDVAQALGYAHGRGIVHRDIKPDNILLDSATGRAMVTDFGIAAVVGEEVIGPTSGTVGFISPEQLAGQPADRRSDLYSLGVVAHLALTGALPAGGGRRETGGDSLSSAVARCLSDDPDARFVDAEALLAAIDETRSVARSSLPPVLRRWVSEHAPLAPLYGFVSATSGVAVVRWVAIMIRDEAGPGIVPFFYIMLALTVLPLIPTLAFEGRKTIRTLVAGYRLSDLRFALKTWRAERIAEIDREDRSLRLRDRMLVHLPLLCILGTLSGALFPMGLLFWTNWLQYLFIGSLVLLPALGLPIAPASLRRRFTAGARRLIWGSRIGDWLAKRLAPKGGGVPAAAFRPTEMALEVAIEDLFASLPTSYRESLRDLPAIANRLTMHASAIRDAAGEGSAQLTDTVKALERLRIGLLRLQGGLADLQPVTTALDVARAIDQDITRLVAAQTEISGVRRPLMFEARSPSPA